MEDQITPFDWHRMFFGDVPPLFMLEVFVRILLVYVFAAAVIRWMGKRGRSEMSPLEYMVVIALGSATGDAMLYPDVPIVYAWLVILGVVAVEEGVSHLKCRFGPVERFLETEPRLIVEDGRLCTQNLSREQMTALEVASLLREQGVEHLGQVRRAYLELSGRISVYCYEQDRERVGPSVLPPHDLSANPSRAEHTNGRT